MKRLKTNLILWKFCEIPQSHKPDFGLMSKVVPHFAQLSMQ